VLKLALPKGFHFRYGQGMARRTEPGRPHVQGVGETPGEPAVEWTIGDADGTISITFDHASIEWVPYPLTNSRTSLPSSFDARIDWERVRYGIGLTVVFAGRLPYIKELRVDVARDIRRAMFFAHAEQPSWTHYQSETLVTAGGLRDVNPEELLRLAIVAALHVQDDEGLRPARSHRPIRLDEWDHLAHSATKPDLADDLAEVARVYRDASEVGRPPTKDVMDRCHMTRPTAQRRLRESRVALPHLWTWMTKEPQ
jgi:hypothetical protein